MAYLFFVLSLLFLNGFIYCQECPPGTSPIEYCQGDESPSIGDKRVYNIDEVDRSNAGWLICPLYSQAIVEWSVTMYNNINMAIANGIFCSAQPYNMSQMCMYANGTLRVFPLSLPSNNSQLQLEYTSPGLNTSVNASYAPLGVYIFDREDSPIQSMEGSMLGISFIIFYTGSPSITVTHNGAQFNTDDTRLSIFNDPRCITPESSSDTTLVRIVQFNPVSVADEGVYTVHVTGDAGDYSTSTNVEVVGVTNVTMTPTTSVATLTATSTDQLSSSSTATPIPSNSMGGTQGEGLADGIVWLIVGVGVFFGVAIVIVLIILVFMCCYCKRRSPSSPYQMGVAPETDIKPGDTSKPRLGSFSSVRPLTKSDSNPTLNTTTSDVNYTAVYCSSQYEHCGELLQQKHGDRVKRLTHWEEVRLAILQPSCTDILLFVCPSDEIFKEVMSCGVDPAPPYKRNKLRIMMFTPVDHFPANTLGVNGYRVVLIEGDPDDRDTISTAVNKAEFPELANCSRRSSDTTNTDNHAESVGLGLQRENNELLRQLLETQKTSVGIQGQTLDVQRDQLDTTREVNEREELRTVTEATPTSNETLI